jgi:ubiquinone/menaquinone biosynthesis C-methylase UbiE
MQNRLNNPLSKKEYIFWIVYFLLLSSVVLFSQYDPDAWEAHWNRRQPAGKVMKVLGVKPGMNIGEFGAGRGRYVVQVANIVGPNGAVYANDIDESKTRYLEHRCRRDNISNIKVILGAVTDPKFPKGRLDVVYCINTYHHVEDPVALLRNIIPALKPGGLLAIIEHAPSKAKDMGGHATPKKTVLDQARAAGFKLVRIETFLELDNIYIFRAN